MKILKSKKALSPVVAAIILIAVTVAVSIAVAAWMGALTFTFMSTEELKITNVEFIPVGQTSGTSINMTIQNTGTSTVTVTEIWVGTTQYTYTSGNTIPANSQTEFPISQSWTAGNSYSFKVVTSKGNQFYYTAKAPS